MKTLLALLVTLSPVFALAEPAAQASPTWQVPIMMAIFAVVFWFMVWRPQSKRAKEQKALMSALSKGDEVVTTAGITGRITKVTDDYIQVEVAANVSLTFQKQAISATLPKGTLKAI